MGLFSQWTIFQEAEAVLEHQLQVNLYHPFMLASDQAEENKGL